MWTTVDGSSEPKSILTMNPDQQLEQLLRNYVDDFLAQNTAGRKLDERLRATGVGLRPILDHLTFRTHDIDRRAQEFLALGYRENETIEYNNWYAKVYRRDGYPTLFIDQAYPGPRGAGSIIPPWVDKHGDNHLHHVAVQVDDIEKAIAAMKALGIAFVGEIVGERGGALRQIFTAPELRDGEAFSVLELAERHFGFKGFSPPQADGLMQSSATKPR
jgi:catechol 2,3-dioxygenase-like lactoylglutathione lyase family enzyme